MFKAKCAMDKKFAAKFLYTFDIRIQRWLRECRRAKDRSEVDDSSLNLHELVNDVLNARFYQELPPSFVSMGDVEIEDDIFEERGRDSDSKKKRKGKEKRNSGNDDSKKTRLINSNQVESFRMLDGED